MKRCLVILFACVGVISSHAAASVTVDGLRCENLVDPLALDTTVPRFSWKLRAEQNGVEQKAYRIEVASDPQLFESGTADLWDSGKIDSGEQVLVPYAGKPLRSRDIGYWRVRVWSKGGASEWSQVGRFGVGIVEEVDIDGRFIGYPSSGAVSPLLRSRFTAGTNETALLHVNSLGYHEVYINGRKVSEDVLSPAISQMNKRSLVVTYDVGEYIHPGQNELVIWLGQGWYKKGTFGRWEEGDPYSEPLVRAQLDVRRGEGWQTVCATDSSWECALSGYTDTGSWNALDFGGEELDARRNPENMTVEALDRLEWRAVITKDKQGHIASPQMCEPNRVQQTLVPVSISGDGDGTWLVDMGRVVTGWFELDMPAMTSGHTVRIEYSDEIADNGQIEEQKQYDTYIARGEGKEAFRNKFNHHAFRYVKLFGLPAAPAVGDIRAHLIHTDYAAAASFECSDADLNAIHDMVFYTLSCLAYSGYMVDCPHLERAGYGGDGNSSTEALQTMYDVAPLYANWVQSWSDAMRTGGSLPHVAPNAGAGGGGPYWCGFMVMAPWRTYLNYGDRSFIEKYYPAMQQWLGYVDKYTVDGLLTRWPDTPYRDWFLGDWLAPWGVDTGNPTSISLVNNCFISECFAVMAKMAALLDREDDARKYAAAHQDLNRLLHEKFFNPADNSYATGSQLDMTYPMLVGVTPDTLRGAVTERLLADQTMNGHIGGGLVGVPIITEWAIESHAAEWMYGMLKKRDYPGYLHMIENGATTTWEYWSGERSRVHNCYNGIGTWFYQALGGLRPDERQPAYRHFFIEPQIPEGVAWSKVTKQTPYGEIKLNWELRGEELVIEAVVPPGTTATVVVPAGATSYRFDTKKCSVSDNLALESGKHEIIFQFH
jgi:alpha-L-rhamnosidase